MRISQLAATDRVHRPEREFGVISMYALSTTRSRGRTSSLQPECGEPRPKAKSPTQVLECPADLFALTDVVLARAEVFRDAPSVTAWPPGRYADWARAVERQTSGRSLGHLREQADRGQADEKAFGRRPIHHAKRAPQYVFLPGCQQLGSLQRPGANRPVGPSRHHLGADQGVARTRWGRLKTRG